MPLLLYSAAMLWIKEQLLYRMPLGKLISIVRAIVGDVLLNSWRPFIFNFLGNNAGNFLIVKNPLGNFML